jgi:hemoglobin/transferrin/lactoferrin receptor protein
VVTKQLTFLWIIIVQISFLNLQMIGGTLSELEPIGVTATRSEKPVLETPGSSSIITANDMQDRGALNLVDAFKYEPGVSVPFDFSGADSLVPYLGTGTKGINIRGMEGNRISINIDGVRQPQEFLTAGGMAGAGRIYFDPATLSQIELFKSANSSLYGTNAMGGVVSGRTVSPSGIIGKDLVGSGLVNATTYASVNDSINNRLLTAWGDGKKAVSLVYSFRTGHERQNHGVVPPDPQRFDAGAVVSKFTARTEIIELTGTIDVFDQKSVTDVNSIEVGNNRSIIHESQRSRERFSIRAQTLPEVEFAYADYYNLSLSIQDSSQETVNLQDRSDNNLLRRRDISFRTSLFGLESSLMKNLDFENFTHDLQIGMELSSSAVESKYLVTDTLQNGSILEDNRKSMAPSDVSELGIYFLDAITFGEEQDWVLSPSLRFDFYEVKPQSNQVFMANSANVGFTPVVYENEVWGTPAISLLHRFNEGINYYFSYNRGIRNPTAEELNGFFEHPPTSSTTSSFIIDANPNLQEERSDSFEMGLQANLAKDVFGVSIFKNYYDGFIDLIKQPSPGVLDLYSNDNVGKVEIHGVEISWKRNDWKLEESFPAFDFGLSFSWSEGDKPDQNQPLNSIEPWKLISFVDWVSDSKTKGIRLTSTYRAKKKYNQIDQSIGEQFSVGDSIVLDASAWFEISDRWKILGGINNLTDEKYFLWSSVRRGGGHSSNSVNEKNTQPGTNAFIKVEASF